MRVIALCCKLIGCEFSPIIMCGSGAFGGGGGVGDCVCRRWTPSINCGVELLEPLIWDIIGGRRGEDAEAAAAASASLRMRARFFCELVRMSSFSAAIPLILGSVGLVGGGVGGISPVIFTRASIPPLKSFIAALGDNLKTSVFSGTFGGLSQSATLNRGSDEGFGGGGRSGTALAFESVCCRGRPSSSSFGVIPAVFWCWSWGTHRGWV